MTLDELNLHWSLVTELNRAQEELRHMSSVLKAQSLDGMPRNSGDSRKVEKLALLISQEADKVSQMEKVVKRSEPPIREWIEGIQDSHTRRLFTLRFLAGYEWAEVAAIVGGKNTEGSVKATCYRWLQNSSG